MNMSIFQLLFSSVLLGFGLGCSCVEDSFRISRSEAICKELNNSFINSIYLAVVQEIYCKCIVSTAEPVEEISCITVNGSFNAVSNETYFCENGFPSGTQFLQKCGAINIGSADDDDPSIDLNHLAGTAPLVIDLTNETNCGFNTDYFTENFELAYGAACVLDHQPCYYTINVTKVIKGNMKVGSLISTSGPDVLTSCGQYGRVLKIGQGYVVGIGDPCSPISSWSEVDSYSSEEFELLERSYCEDMNKNDTSMNGTGTPVTVTDPNSCTSTDASHLVVVLVLMLGMLVLLLL